MNINTYYRNEIADVEDSIEILIENATRALAWESIELFNEVMFDDMYEWFYRVKNVGDKFENLSQSRSEKILDLCNDISVGAIIEADL
jgi:hypothetical protein|tara:strand:+ start:89 stop:352 length:264 start_codon:yes stop_codon:yes gene_type:complete